MNLPFSLGTITLPDWVPGWVPIALLVPLLLYVLLVLAMPFMLIGTRGRLEGIEARLDDLHEELRALALQLGGPVEPPRGRESAPLRDTRRSGRQAARVEPRADWSRVADD